MSTVNLVAKKTTYEVRIENHSTWAEVRQMTYRAFPGTTINVPITWLKGSDYTCVAATNPHVLSQAGLAVTVGNSDLTIHISDAKYKVTVVNEDTEGISSVSPSYRFVNRNNTASFTVNYNSGYDSSSVKVKNGTLSGTSVTATADTPEKTVTLSKITHEIEFINDDVRWITQGNQYYTVRHGSTYTIPISYNAGSNSTCLKTPDGLTVTSSGIVVPNVTASRRVIAQPDKVQIKTKSDTEILSSVSPSTGYAPFNGSYDFSIYALSGFTTSDLKCDIGTISGNTLTVPTTTEKYMTATISDTLQYVEVGSRATTSNYIPSNFYYNYSQSQQIFTKDEIGRSGTIRGIALYMDSSYTQTRNIIVYLGTTSLGYYSSYNDALTFGTSSYRYSGNYTFKRGWNLIMFTNQYTYSNTENLVLAITDQTGNYQNSAEFGGFSSSNYMSLYIYSDSNRYQASARYQYSTNKFRNCIKLLF